MVEPHIHALASSWWDSMRTGGWHLCNVINFDHVMLFYVNGKGLVFVIFFHSHIRVHCLFNIGDQTWDLCIQGGENLIEGFQPSMSMSQPHGAKRVFWQGAQFTPCNLTLI